MSKKAKYVLLLMMVVCGAWTPFRLAAENKQAPIIEKIGQGKDEQIKPGTSPALSAIPPRSEVINKKVEQNALKEDKPPFEISAWIATCISAFVSLGALAVAIYQLRLFKAQLKIMSETLLAAHRARLVVRGFAIEINIEPPLDDKLPRVSFVIANVGDTPAFIEAISIKFHSQTDGN
ncbi:MAG: hypothetical protein JNM52_08835, partial [Betaproteobacteria bacterium]|nr:hypothetical protein [Betaproteobacteria bacterium]